MKDFYVTNHELVIHGNVQAKTYTCSTWKEDGNGYKYMHDCLDKAKVDIANARGVYVEHLEEPLVFVAFQYGYTDRQGTVKSDYVRGADLFFFREPNEPNTVIDSWECEQGGVYASSSKGTFCGTEALILAEEEKLRRAHLGNLELWLASWPTNLPVNVQDSVFNPLL